MSHNSKFKVAIKNFGALVDILKEKGIKFKQGQHTCKLYGNNSVNAELSFRLPGWAYDVAVTKDGEVFYDHYGSASSTFGELGGLIQEYNEVEVTRESLLEGHLPFTEDLGNGWKQVVIEYEYE